jgi:hypothetical protein
MAEAASGKAPVHLSGATQEGESAGGLVVVVGTPPEIKVYRITKEQLDMLRSQKRDHLYEAGALAGGGALGAAAGALEAVWQILARQPLAPAPAISLLLFLLSFGVAAACLVMAATRGKASSNIIDEIEKQHAGR